MGKILLNKHSVCKSYTGFSIWKNKVYLYDDSACPNMNGIPRLSFEIRGGAYVLNKDTSRYEHILAYDFKRQAHSVEKYEVVTIDGELTLFINFKLGGSDESDYRS